MRLLDRYILREIGGVFIFGVMLFSTLLLVNHLFFVARFVANAATSIGTTLVLLVLRVPYLATFSLPFATLFAVLLSFGRLSERNEVTAMRTSGWSMARLAVPVVVAGVMVMLGAFALGEWVVPASETRYRLVLADVVRSPAQLVQYNILFREEIGGVESVFHVRQLDPKEGTMASVTVTQFVGQRLSRVIVAEEARYSPRGWVLYRGALYLLGPDSASATTFFQEMRVALARTPRQIAAPGRDPYEMSIRELRQQIAALRAAGESFVKHAVSLQTKLALPMSSVLFALLAVPLGLRPQRGGRAIGFGVTVLVLLLYWLMMSITVTLGEQGRIGTIWAAWLPNCVVACVGAMLLWRASRT